jgi:hypothetical protein
MLFAKRLLMGAGAVALAGLLGVAIAPKVAHGVAATPVRVVNTTANVIPAVQAPAAGDLYQETASASYAFTSGAACSFPAPPSGKTLVVESASVWSANPAGADPQYAVLSTSTASLSYIALQAQAPGVGTDNYVGALQGRIYATSALAITVNLNGTGTAIGVPGNLTCTISGYLVPAI